MYIVHKLELYATHTYLESYPGGKKCPDYSCFLQIFVHKSGFQMSLKTKKSIEGFLRKSDFKFFPYLTMAGNWSKITKESMWKRASIDKWH